MRKKSIVKVHNHAYSANNMHFATPLFMFISCSKIVSQAIFREAVVKNDGATIR
jgi:hypothetical protein